MPDSDLIPISPEDFERDMRVQLTVMRQRREVAGIDKVDLEGLAKKLAGRLLKGTFKPMREPTPSGPSAHSVFAGPSSFTQPPVPVIKIMMVDKP